jgi:hypothetical protein
MQFSGVTTMSFFSRWNARRRPNINNSNRNLGGSLEKLEDRQLLTGISITAIPSDSLENSTVIFEGAEERHRITSEEYNQLGLTAGDAA